MTDCPICSSRKCVDPDNYCNACGKTIQKESRVIRGAGIWTTTGAPAPNRVFFGPIIKE